MRNFLILALYMNLIGFSCFAQLPSLLNSRSTPIGDYSELLEVLDKVRSFNNTSRQILGDPYLLADWSKGVIYASNGKVYKDIQLKYDIHTNDLFYKAPITNDSSLVKSQFIDAFSIYDEYRDSTFYFNRLISPIKGKKILNVDFYQQLNNGRTLLLLRHEKVILKFNTSDPVNNRGNLPDEYKTRNSYFIRKANRSIWPLGSSKKKLLKIFLDHSNEVEKYIDRNQLDIKKIADILKVIKFYDSLYQG